MSFLIHAFLERIKLKFITLLDKYSVRIIFRTFNNSTYVINSKYKIQNFDRFIKLFVWIANPVIWDK